MCLAYHERLRVLRVPRLEEILHLVTGDIDWYLRSRRPVRGDARVGTAGQQQLDYLSCGGWGSFEVAIDCGYISLTVTIAVTHARTHARTHTYIHTRTHARTHARRNGRGRRRETEECALAGCACWGWPRSAGEISRVPISPRMPPRTARCSSACRGSRCGTPCPATRGPRADCPRTLRSLALRCCEFSP